MGDDIEKCGSHRCGIQNGRCSGVMLYLQVWYTEWEMNRRYVEFQIYEGHLGGNGTMAVSQ